MRISSIIVVAGLLTGCASAPSTTYVRVDGQKGEGNPELQKQFAVDNAVCKGRAANADMLSTAPAPRRMAEYDTVFKGCMAERGYLPESTN